MVRVTVTHKKVSPVLPLIVVAGSGPHLLGRSWLQELALEVHTVHQVAYTCRGPPASDNKLEQLLRKHEAAFEDERGTLKQLSVLIRTPSPSSSSPCQSLMRVENELDRLLGAKIIEPVTHSEWAAAPIVPKSFSKPILSLCALFFQ